MEIYLHIFACQLQQSIWKIHSSRYKQKLWHDYSTTDEAWNCRYLSCAMNFLCFKMLPYKIVADIVHFSDVLFNYFSGISDLISLSNIQHKLFFVFKSFVVNPLWYTCLCYSEWLLWWWLKVKFPNMGLNITFSQVPACTY